MLVAYYLGDNEAFRAFLSDPGKFYAAAPFTFLLASLIAVIFGAGLFSLDRLLAWRWRKKPATATTPVQASADRVKVA
jgi:putative oxidoreductase